MYNAVAALDIDVDIRQRDQMIAFIVISILEKFYPKTQLADVHGVWIDIHAKQAILYDVTFFTEQHLLQFQRSCVALIGKSPAFFVTDYKFIVNNLDGVSFHRQSLIVQHNPQTIFDFNKLV